MLSQAPSNLKALFLLQFTNETILQFAPKRNLQKKGILQKQPLLKISQKQPIQDKKILNVPKTKIPAHLQYLKPNQKQAEIEFGKIDGLIFDPLVKEIECNGPNQPILIRGSTGTKEVNLALTREEIDDLIKEFSDASKIPVHEGLFKVFTGRFSFSAIISEIIGSKFIITKLNYDPNFR
jgi:hypothetical protein